VNNPDTSSVWRSAALNARAPYSVADLRQPQLDRL